MSPALSSSARPTISASGLPSLPCTPATSSPVFPTRCTCASSIVLASCSASSCILLQRSGSTGCSARGLVGYEGHVPHIDDVQLRARFLGQVGGRGEGQLCLRRAVSGQEDLGRKDAHRFSLPLFDVLTALKPYDASRRALALPGKC